MARVYFLQFRGNSRMVADRAIFKQAHNEGEQRFDCLIKIRVIGIQQLSQRWPSARAKPRATAGLSLVSSFPTNVSTMHFCSQSNGHFTLIGKHCSNNNPGLNKSPADHSIHISLPPRPQCSLFLSISVTRAMSVSGSHCEILHDKTKSIAERPSMAFKSTARRNLRFAVSSILELTELADSAYSL